MTSPIGYVRHRRSASAASSLMLWLCIVTCSQLVPRTDASHILLTPYPYRSHVAEMTAIGKALLGRGHRVTILLSASYPELEQLRAESGFQVVDYAVADPDFYTRKYPESDSESDPMIKALELDPIEDLRQNLDGFEQFCTNLLADATLADRLLNSSYGRPDLALTDCFPYYRCAWILLYQLGIPYASTTAQYEPWLWRVPALPSFVPFPWAADGLLTERMTFWQRVENIRTVVDWTAFPGVRIVEDRFVQDYLPDETYATLAARSVLWLIDTDTVVDYARPVMPNEVRGLLEHHNEGKWINIGGLSTRPASPLQEGPLEQFARQSINKLVVVSFGSNDFASPRYFEQLFDAFRQLHQLNFVWRYDGQVPARYREEPWPSNVLLQKWLPQNDLLGHNHTVLFISHCGANSQYEAIFHGVPMICLTIWSDQMSNAQRMQYRGLGINLGRFPTVRTNTLADSIREVAYNRKYADNMSRASAIFKSRPMNACQTAVWWLEHVIQHGASHLHSHAVDMVWYEYLLLDVIVVFVLLPVVVITSGATALASWLLSRRNRSLSDAKKTQ